MIMNEVLNNCETYYSNVTLLLMVIFFFIGFSFFSHYKVKSFHKDETNRDIHYSWNDDDDKIRGFFTDSKTVPEKH